MKKIVVKFGGSVLKNPEGLQKIEKIINSYNNYLIIVVSALFSVTDKLSEILGRGNLSGKNISRLIKSLRRIHHDFLDHNINNLSTIKLTKKDLDQRLKVLNDHLTGLMLIGEIPESSHAFVLSFGERLSSIIIASILNYNGIGISVSTPEDIGIHTSGPPLNARVDLKRSRGKIKKKLTGDKNYLIPGFYGININNKVSVFGRGGSDYTAAVIAGCIEAESCDLWKDVDGFMTADPAIIKNASTIPLLSYGEAAELSYFGARITHPETFASLKPKNIPLKIYNSGKFNGNGRLPPPSTIIHSKIIKRRDVIKSITGSTDFAILRIKGSGVGIHPGIISNISRKLNDKEINIRSIITSQTTINFLLISEDIDNCLSIVRAMNIPEIENISAEKDIALIAAVGNGFRDSYGVAAKILTALSEFRINVQLMTAGASDDAIYLTIRKTECEKAIRSLHHEFFEAQHHI